MFLFGGVRVRVPVFVCESESVLLYIRAGQVVYIAFRQFRVSFLGWMYGLGEGVCVELGWFLRAYWGPNCCCYFGARTL